MSQRKRERGKTPVRSSSDARFTPKHQPTKTRHVPFTVVDASQRGQAQAGQRAVCAGWRTLRKITPGGSTAYVTETRHLPAHTHALSFSYTQLGLASGFKVGSRPSAWAARNRAMRR